MTVGLTRSGKLIRTFGGVNISATRCVFFGSVFRSVSTILMFVFGAAGSLIIALPLRKNLATRKSTDGTSLTETGNEDRTIEYGQVTRDWIIALAIFG